MLPCDDLNKMTKHNGQNNPYPAGEMTFAESTQAGALKVLVLVVDDDERILRFVRSSLRLAGYNIITATSGEEALKLVKSKKPQIMVLDILMPQTDGFEVLKRLRSVSKLPVIAISAHASASDKALILGANGFMSKPFRPDELIKKIEAVLYHKG
jgi:DNA-binding response OmpR family regulator